jgi:sec-independent protein translocase protein TatA
MRFGLPEILLIVVVVLLFFGARRIPELMRGLGRGAREFKEGLRDGDSKNEDETKH